MIMFARSLLALATTAALVAGKTPAGFTPGTDTDLFVTYGQVAPQNGMVVDKAAVGSAPVLATETKLTGDEYAVIMLDLDIPFDVRPHVLLHWMQTGLSPAATATTLATSAGARQLFALRNAANTTALAAYIPPAPPARTPLSHRYVEILLDTSSLSATGLAALQDAATTRLAFDLAAVLAAAGLQESVVAGNFYNVTNPGPVDTPVSTPTPTPTNPGGGEKTPLRGIPDSLYPDDELIGRNSTTGAGSARPSGVNTGSAAAISSKAALAFSAASRATLPPSSSTLAGGLLFLVAALCPAL